jgi:4-aminobutyrate aminotransferase
MVGLEFVQPGVGDGRVPAGATSKAVIEAALRRRLLLLRAGPYDQVIRLIPPLVTTADEVDLALRILDESLAEAGA